MKESDYKTTVEEQALERGKRRRACELSQLEKLEKEEEKEIWEEDLPVLLVRQAD